MDEENNNIEYNPAPVPNYDPEAAAVLVAQEEANAIVAEQNQTVDDQDPFEAARVRAEEEYNNQLPEVYSAEDLGVDQLSPEELANLEQQQAQFRNVLKSEDQLNADAQSRMEALARQQATYQARYKQPGNNDWRVRLVLAEGSDYLYKDNSNTLLAPLRNANGVIFPYTPKIEYVEDSEGIRKRGILKKQLNTFGITTVGQAKRFGKHFLYQTAKENSNVSMFDHNTRSAVCL